MGNVLGMGNIYNLHLLSGTFLPSSHCKKRYAPERHDRHDVTTISTYFHDRKSGMSALLEGVG